jgi:nitronate monooxygenase
MAETRAMTNRSFAANLFVIDEATADAATLKRANALLKRYRDELGLPEPAPLARYGRNFSQQVEAILEHPPKVFSVTFGIPDRAVLKDCKRLGVVTIATASTVEEAEAIEAAGVDAVCAQGAEAGGHRSTFLGPFEDGLIGTMALVPQVVDRVKIPVIAAGGIMDGRGVAAALALGAQAAQIGTAFMSCPEAQTPQPHRRALTGREARVTAVTRTFSGRFARGIKNRFMAEMAAGDADIPPYPIQNELTQDIRKAAAQADKPEYMSLWAGQAAPLSRPMPAGELMARLVAEMEAAMKRLGANMAAGGSS